MASIPKASSSEQVSSDDENRLTQRRFESNEEARENDTRRPSSEDSDDEPLITQVFVKVEINEEDSPLDMTTKKVSEVSNVSSTSTSCKKLPKPKIEKKKRQYSCPNCDAVYESVAELKTHSVEHQIETRHKCEQCGRCFKKASSLKVHRRVHDERQCPLCDLSFPLKIQLDRHIMTHERTQKCTQCPAKYHTKKQLQIHTTGHLKRSGSQNGRTHDTKKKRSHTAKSKNEAKNDTADTKTQPLECHYIKIEIESDNEHEQNNCNTSEVFLTEDSLNHSTKCAIVNKMHMGKSVSDICTFYKLTPEVANQIWEGRDKYVVAATRKTSKYMNKVLDERLVEWYNSQKDKVHVTGKMLQDAAEMLAKACGFVSFYGSKKWLDRFKKRCNITLGVYRANRGYNNVQEPKWRIEFFKENWCDARVGFTDDDIYNADEVGLFYNASKARVKKLASKKYIQGHTEDRLSIFMCTNASGTDKKKLLVCGTEDPLIRSYRSEQTLPVKYVRHEKAHFITDSFEEYVKNWNDELQTLNKKALLILDRATIHSKLQLSHLKLIFVPWKASNSLIPIKNGIFNKFRDEFRKLLLQEKAMNAITGVDRNLTCLEALNMFAKAWERTPSDIISKSFHSVGYDVQNHTDNNSAEIPKIASNDEEVMCTMLKDYNVESYFTNVSQLDMYLTVDEELLTGQGTHASVFGGNHRVLSKKKETDKNLPICTEKPITRDNEILVTRTRALEDLEIVRKYLEAKKTNYETYTSFLEVEKFVLENSLS